MTNTARGTMMNGSQGTGGGMGCAMGANQVMPIAAAATDLGLSQTDLQTQLHAGKSLTAIATAQGILGNHHHITDRLPPRQLVRVMLERTDEHHRDARQPGCVRRGGNERPDQQGAAGSSPRSTCRWPPSHRTRRRSRTSLRHR